MWPVRYERPAGADCSAGHACERLTRRSLLDLRPRGSSASDTPRGAVGTVRPGVAAWLGETGVWPGHTNRASPLHLADEALSAAAPSGRVSEGDRSTLGGGGQGGV